MKYIIVFCLSFLIFTANIALAQQKGAALYSSKACISCHGINAQGNEVLRAPALAGQDYDYLARQLTNFKNSWRGYDKDDAYGKVMVSIAKALNDTQIQELSLYLNQLKPQELKPVLSGDPSKGEAIFTVCAACHGADATGLKQFNSANLQVINDWYKLQQIKNYADKKRGRVDLDPIGATMAPNALLFSNDQDIKDVLAYINLLRYPNKK